MYLARHHVPAIRANIDDVCVSFPRMSCLSCLSCLPKTVNFFLRLFFDCFDKQDTFDDFCNPNTNKSEYKKLEKKYKHSNHLFRYSAFKLG